MADDKKTTDKGQDVEALKAQLAQQEETVKALAAENEKLQSKVTSAGRAIKPSVTVDGKEYNIRFARVVMIDGDNKTVVTADQIAADAKLAAKLVAEGCGALVLAGAKAEVKKKHQAKRAASQQTMIVR